jgi:hypothetical protein
MVAAIGGGPPRLEPAEELLYWIDNKTTYGLPHVADRQTPRGAVMQTMIEHGIDTAMMIGVALLLSTALIVNAALIVGVVLAVVRSTLARSAPLVVSAATADPWHDTGAGDNGPGSVPRSGTMHSFRAHPAELSGSEGLP